MAKWGKIGSPHSPKRKEWLRRIRRNPEKAWHLDRRDLMRAEVELEDSRLRSTPFTRGLAFGRSAEAGYALSQSRSNPVCSCGVRHNPGSRIGRQHRRR